MQNTIPEDEPGCDEESVTSAKKLWQELFQKEEEQSFTIEMANLAGFGNKEFFYFGSKVFCNEIIIFYYFAIMSGSLILLIYFFILVECRSSLESDTFHVDEMAIVKVYLQ